MNVKAGGLTNTGGWRVAHTSVLRVGLLTFPRLSTALSN